MGVGSDRMRWFVLNCAGMFYILATSKVISGSVPNYDNARSDRTGRCGRIGRTWVSRAEDRGFKPMVESNHLVINLISIRCSVLSG